MKKYIFISVLLLNLFACKKDGETTGDDDKLSTLQILTAHVWRGVEVVRYVDDVEDSHTDISNLKLSFNDDYTYKIYEGSNIKEDGTWELFDNSIIIIRTRYYSTTYNMELLNDFTVFELNINKLAYSLPVIDGSNHIIRDDYYYVK